MKDLFYKKNFNQGEVQKTFFWWILKRIFFRRKGLFFERTRLKKARKRPNKKEKNNWRVSLKEMKKENEKGDRKQEEQHRKEKGG